MIIETGGLISVSLGATTAFANTTLETWDQTNIRTGCMNCHNTTKVNDFLFSLQMNAYAPPSATASGAAPSLAKRFTTIDLGTLLQSHVK